jgi:hypothetical protein
MRHIKGYHDRLIFTIVRNYSRKEYYEKAREYLINPVQKAMEVEWSGRIGFQKHTKQGRVLSVWIPV